MSMDVCAQTLVLVDNDLSVSKVNQKLTVATLKYLFYHSPENRAYSLNVYEHNVCGNQEFVTDVNDLVCKADTLVYEEKDSNLVDTLSEVLKSWKESDFACRDIIVFTDGIEGVQINHEKEELYYLINNSDYPIYVVYLNQENNADKAMVLNAIATTSSGELINTEFPGDDAEIDRQITEKIFAKMEEYEMANWQTYTGEEQEEELSGNEGSSDSLSEEEIAKTQPADMQEEYFEEYVESAEAASAYSLDASSDVIYREEKPSGFFSSPFAIIIAGAGIAISLLVAVLGSMYVMKSRRKNISVKIESDRNSCDFDSKTTLFCDSKEAEDEYETRLLTNESAVTLELVEENNREEPLTIFLGCDMSIGRKAGECDVVIADDTVSKKHCVLTDEKGEVYVRDMSSSNGTFVNGRRITRCRLLDGDMLKIGKKSYFVRFSQWKNTVNDNC